MKIRLSYQPLNIQGSEITEQDYTNYLILPKQAEIARAIAISPFEDKMKESSKDTFDFGDFKVTKKPQQRTITSWEKAYDALLKFLEVRADDSRAYNMDGLGLFDGIGYCILTKDLKDFIEKETKNNSSTSEFPLLYWPRMKKGEEFPHSIIFPEINYSKINPETGQLVLKAKRFASGLEKEVTEPFKEANKQWFEQETEYSMNKLPETSEKIEREIAEGKYAFIQLVRENVPRYKEIIETLKAELQDLENNVPLQGYKVARDKKGTYVNIKNVYERLAKERLAKDNLIKVEGRYEIVP
ncbi:MAG: hypothetical protein WC438_03115 [Candidatus Pacearchaeota archaeon]